MRSRLIAGLKRYFHAKRMEGLLSAEVRQKVVVLHTLPCAVWAQLNDIHKLPFWAGAESMVAASIACTTGNQPGPFLAICSTNSCRT
jgi:hypothetical protein